MNLFAEPQQAYFIPQNAIGPFRAKVTVEISATHDLEITQHQVQEGASITDHAYVKPETVTIKAMFDDENEPLPDLYQRLIDFQASREPFDVVTGKHTYTSMLVASLGTSEDVLTKAILAVHFSLQKIIIVSVSSVSVPPRARQSKPQQTGKKEEGGQKKTVQDDEFVGPPEQQKSKLAAFLGY